MNEVHFVLRRILKEAEEFTAKDYEDAKKIKDLATLSLVSYRARLQLINHLYKTFTKEEE